MSKITISISKRLTKSDLCRIIRDVSQKNREYAEENECLRAEVEILRTFCITFGGVIVGMIAFILSVLL